MVKVYLMRIDEPQDVSDGITIVDTKEKAEKLIANEIFDYYDCYETLSDKEIAELIKNPI